MPYIAPKHPWYTFFFGVRGLLRLFAAILAFAYAIYICAALGTDGPLAPRIAGAAAIAFSHTATLALVTGLFSIALWFGLHSSVEPGRWGFYQAFSEECEDYDWWGRRLPNRRQ